METIKIPGPLRITWGSLGSWYLAHLINPGFNGVAILLICLIPVVTIEIYFFIPAKTKFTAPESSSPDQPISTPEDPA